ncbi:MAG: hypothetical protein N3B10_07490 [Armatimonadetes bacterium]|nr:hypothetical protein [Armatimonadota bacterium]MCX7968317.1 hypothetical protein [Armatimonadota bacterium]MDW8142387.1 hypothetical protein [Armatimonadota bacterium]
MKPEGKIPKEQQGKEQKFIVAPETELALIRARQKLAITIGVIAFLLLAAGGSIAFLLLQKYQQGLVQTPTPSEKPTSSLVQTPTTQQVPLGSNIAQLPQQQETSSLGLVQTPPPPPVPSPVQGVQPSVPTQSLLTQPQRPQLQPPPMQQPPTQIQRPTVPAGLLDYLEQLKRIEMQRKREASNYWVAISALDDLLKALQGVAATGDILDAPEYNPQKTLQTYDAYLQRFLMLRQWLHQLKPPPECQQLHQAYDQALLAHIGTINSLKQRIILKDLAGAALSGLTAQKQVDTALRIADNELASVCQRYGITKTFDIGDNR